MSRGEFVALVAMMFSTVAFSMDAILPALPQIGAALTPQDLSHAPLVLTAFFGGLGVGTFFAGPLSDAFGRKPVMIAGSLLYIVAALVAWSSQSLEVMLAARVVQGLGGAGPRIVALAVTRDLFSGREMARLVSFIMMVFALVPGFAPLLGQWITDLFGWRSIFLAFVVFSLVCLVWMILRLPETLRPGKRRPLRLRPLSEALVEVFRNRTVRLSILAQTLCMATLIGLLMMVQQIYGRIYGRADTFAYWFGAAAIVSASASWLNAVLVVRLGMRRLVTAALLAQIAISLTLLVTGALDGPYGFGIFVAWQISLFLQAGLTLGNLNAIGMEPMGHIAGMAASIIGGVSTVAAAGIAAPVITFLTDSAQPLLIFVLLMAVPAVLIMFRLARVEQQQAVQT